MRCGKIFISMMIIMILLLQFTNFFIPISASSDIFEFVSSNWGSIDNPQNVYAGSSDVVLILEILSKYPYTLSSVIGNLSLPAGFTDVNGYNYTVATATVQTNSTTKSSVDPGEVFKLSYILNINKSVSPGIYSAVLNLTYNYYNETSKVLNSSVYVMNDIPLKVSSFPSYSFKVKKVTWYATNIITNATVGSHGLSLHILTENNANVSIDDLYAYLNLKDPFSPIQVSIHYGGVGSMTSFELVFDGINIRYDSVPGIYMEDLSLNYTFRGYGDAVKEYNTHLNISLYVSPSINANLELIKISWQGFNKGYSGVRGSYISVVLENMGDYTITDVQGVGHLPEGFNNQFNGNTVNDSYTGNIGYGDFIDFSLGPMYIEDSVNPGIYYMNLCIHGVGNLNGVDVTVGENISVPIVVNEYFPQFELIDTEWSYNNGPALALPGARDISLVIKLAYRGEEDISGIDPHIILPNEFTIKSISQTPQKINPSSIFTLSFALDISPSIKYGDYVSTLKIRYTVSPNGQDTVKLAVLSIPYHITDSEEISTGISVLNIYWGVDKPTYAYPGTQENPLTITLFNKGVYDAHEIYIVYSVPEGFYISPNATAVTDLLRSGGFIQTTVYGNISEDASPGYHELNISIHYELTVYGAVLNKSEDYSLTIFLSNSIYPPPYLKIIGYNWEGNLDVYPGTKHVNLQISIEDDSIYTVSGIHLYVDDVRGISLSEGSNYIYLAGPVSQWQAFTVSLDLNISNDIFPGTYPLNLTLDYVLNSGGDGRRIIEHHVILVRISKLDGIRYIMYSWVGGGSGPGSAGSTLILVFRNDEFSTMKGLYATVSLPRGFLSTTNDQNIFNITPYSISSLSQLTNLISSGEASSLESLASSTSAEVSQGDYIVISLNLIIGSNTSTGHYHANVTLDFLDNWSIERIVKLICGFSLPGSTDYIEVLENSSKIYIGEREANVSITLKNPGTATIYDVYVSLNSVSQMITFSSAVRHLDIIRSGEEKTLVWKASVSPSASFIGGAPVLVSMIFTDPSGVRHAFNQTAILFIEAYAKLKLIDMNVYPQNPYPLTQLSVSATIVNVGNDVAKNTEVYIVGDHLITNSDSYSFLGDIDIGSQIPFTLYGQLENYTGQVTINLIIRYYNIYNEVKTFKYPVKITISGMTPTKEKESITILFIRDYWMVIVIVGVVAFLMISTFFIYRMYVVSKKKLEMG